MTHSAEHIVVNIVMPPNLCETAAKCRLLVDKAVDLYEHITQMGTSREVSLAKTKLEEALMWAALHIKNSAD